MNGLNGFSGRRCLVAIACAGVLSLASAVAELADVYLKSGLTLRGDVTTTEDEVIVRNAAGEVRLAREDVERIVPVKQPATRPSTQPATSPSTQPTTTPAQPGAAVEGEGDAGEEVPGEDAKKPDRAELPPAPRVSDRDIQRLRMQELLLDGPAELVRVRFIKKGKQRDLASEVLEELKQRTDYRPAWGETLTRGQPHEKLQLILRETGLKYADRIEILSDPEVFTTYRRRVLPLVNRSCARSGCHGGKTARLFRFPTGSTTSETYAYTSFILLDQMETSQGPLLDRSHPESSLLLSYMLPQDGTERAHPDVGRGPNFKPVIRTREDSQYTALVDWIAFLVMPHPDYGLEYKNPYAGLIAAPKEEGKAKEGPQKPAAESKPAGEAETRPATQPAATQPIAEPGREAPPMP